MESIRETRRRIEEISDHMISLLDQVGCLHEELTEIADDIQTDIDIANGLIETDLTRSASIIDDIERKRVLLGKVIEKRSLKMSIIKRLRQEREMYVRRALM